MEYNKLISILILSMFLFSLVSAEITWDIVKQGECIRLEQSCPTCTYVNITMIAYPNDTATFPNYEMSKEGTKFYYDFCNTTLLGNYHATLQGDKDGVTDTEEGYFEVTPTGKNMNFALIILYFFLFTCLIGGMFLFNKRKKEIKKISGDWDLFKMFLESVNEFKFFINWILLVCIFGFTSNFFWIFGFNIFHMIFNIIFYLSLIVFIPVIIIFIFKFFDVRKRCNELANIAQWGGR